MSWPLLSLCLAAFAMTGLVVSGAVSVALPGLDRLAQLITPKNRVRLWLAVAVWPTVVAATAVFVSFLPALGFGWGHHVTHGPHHPHLCTDHTSSVVKLILMAVAILTILRACRGLFRLIGTLRLSEQTSRSLVEASQRHEDFYVFGDKDPTAFVLGVKRARIHVSQGLVDMGSEVAVPVIAHERAHALRQDLLWRTLLPVLTGGHLSSVAACIRRRICTGQEMAADLQAADHLQDGRLRIAQALLTLAKHNRDRTPAVAFTDGGLKARVLALLAPVSPRARWPLHAFMAAWLTMPIGLVLMHDLIHHGLEALLHVLV